MRVGHVEPQDHEGKQRRMERGVFLRLRGIALDYPITVGYSSCYAVDGQLPQHLFGPGQADLPFYVTSPNQQSGGRPGISGFIPCVNSYKFRNIGKSEKRSQAIRIILPLQGIYRNPKFKKQKRNPG